MNRFFSLIKEGAVYSSTTKKVIKEQDYTCLVEASQILESAQAEAQDRIAQAEEECHRLREMAKEEGFQEGLTLLNQKIIELDQEKKRLLHEMNRLILPLALKAAKKIVSHELATHPEIIVDIVLQALSLALNDHKVTIYLHPSDKKLVEQEKTRIKEKLEQVEVLILVEKEELAPGGCIIETESGIINATVENQWRAIEAAFDKYVELNTPQPPHHTSEDIP